MVKLYALSTCPWCKKTKKFLNENGIAYDVIDVDLMEESEQDRVMLEVEKLSGGRSFPVIICGGQVLVGYDPNRILEALRNEG